MPTYDIRISGYAANVTADSPEAAIKSIKDYAGLYSTFTVLDSMSGNMVPMTIEGEWKPADTIQADSRMERK
jgi:hypothetical protein